MGPGPQAVGVAWRPVPRPEPGQQDHVQASGESVPELGDWGKTPEPEEAAPTVIAAYLGAYGLATPEVFDRWLSLNSTSRPRLRQWFADLGDTLTEVDVEGPKALMLTEHVEELADIEACKGTRLLSGFDQYLLGPGTNDEALLPKEHRSAVSRTSRWTPIVVVNGSGCRSVEHRRPRAGAVSVPRQRAPTAERPREGSGTCYARDRTEHTDTAPRLSRSAQRHEARRSLTGHRAPFLQC
jgi:hypothetical protein